TPTTGGRGSCGSPSAARGASRRPRGSWPKWRPSGPRTSALAGWTSCGRYSPTCARSPTPGGRAPAGGAGQAGLGRGQRLQPLHRDRPAAAQAAPVGALCEPLRRPLDGVQVAPGAFQQPEQLGAVEPDRHAFGVVLVVVRGEGLLFGQRVDLRRERGNPLRGGGALGGEPRGRFGRRAHGAQSKDAMSASTSACDGPCERAFGRGPVVYPTRSRNSPGRGASGTETVSVSDASRSHASSSGPNTRSTGLPATATFALPGMSTLPRRSVARIAMPRRGWISAAPCSRSPFMPISAALPYARIDDGSPMRSSARSVRLLPSTSDSSTRAEMSVRPGWPASGLAATAPTTTRRSAGDSATPLSWTTCSSNTTYFRTAGSIPDSLGVSLASRSRPAHNGVATLSGRTAHPCYLAASPIAGGVHARVRRCLAGRGVGRVLGSRERGCRRCRLADPDTRPGVGSDIGYGR